MTATTRTAQSITTDIRDGVAVGKSGVCAIRYHAALGEGDRHYCDIDYDNGTTERLFTFDAVCFGVDSNGSW